jgi:C1A family cysteine protease
MLWIMNPKKDNSLFIQPFLLLTLLTLAMFMNLTPLARAETPPGLPLLGTEDPFSIPQSRLRNDADKIMLANIEEVGTKTVSIPFDNPQNIYALSITGKVGLNSDESSVKVILVDNAMLREYLLYETYPILTDQFSFSIQEVCEETCLLPQIPSFSLRIELEEAFISIRELTYAVEPKAGDPAAVKAMQDTAKIQKINQQNLGWIAGETSVSTLTYEEKKRLFLQPEVPNLQGFEYYQGGVFEIPSAMPISPSASVLVDNFTWGDRHGKNWITPVKDQGRCGSCWAFATAGATEAVTNLYFNQHLNLDLAEQDALSCSGAGDCSWGGLPGPTLDYFANTGIVEEACFPYSATDQACNKCRSPDELINISGRIPFGSSGYLKTEDTLKRMIIENGPVSGGIRSLRHAMTLVGFAKDYSDGRTIWIFKNSWGSRWGGKQNGEWGGDVDAENGYAHVKLDINNIGWTHAIQTPIISSTAYSINCVDEDGDQFCNWGISKDKPSTCPAFCKPQSDCDDSNPNISLFDANYNCGDENQPPPPPSEKHFTVYNDGDGALSVNSITPENQAPWISVLTATPFDVSPGGSKDVSVQVDYSKAPVGRSTTRLLVSSNDPDENPYPEGVNIVVERNENDSTEGPAAGQSQLAQIKFQGLKTSYNVGENLVVGLMENVAVGSRNQAVDLWIAILLPTGELLFETLPLFSFSLDPQPFKRSVSNQETKQSVLEFTIPEGMGGDYTFYALYVVEGKNPLTDGLEAVARSNLAMQTVTLAD